MIRDIPLAAQKILFMRKSDIPEEYREQLNDELLHINIKREKGLAAALIAINIVLIFSDIFLPLFPGGDDVIYKRFLYTHSALLLVPVIYLGTLYLMDRYCQSSTIYRKTLHILLNVTVLALCAILAVYAESINGQPFSYVISMFCIASIVLLPEYERLFIYFFSYVFYTAGLLMIHGSSSTLTGEVLFSTLLVLTAIAVSRVNFNSYIKNYMDNKVIIQKTEELDRMYKFTEEALKERTKQLKEAVEYEKMRTVFFANISHELRTPLNVIFSAEQMLDFLLKNTKIQGDDKEINQYMGIIKQNCYRLIRLIANLIDITKIDTGYFQVSLKNCDIVRVVEDITLSVAKYVEDKDINLVFDTEVEEKVVACDPDKIERIVLNLLSNAVKFTSKGGDIFVNIYEDGGKISISVKDSGIGIPPDMQKLIFERFVQVDKTTVRNREGSGIGLSIVKSLVEMHGGTIRLISEPGKGSEFIIDIPDRTIPSLEYAGEPNGFKEDQNIERINIEFSDIYF